MGCMRAGGAEAAHPTVCWWCRCVPPFGRLDVSTCSSITAPAVLTVAEPQRQHCTVFLTYGNLLDNLDA